MIVGAAPLPQAISIRTGDVGQVRAVVEEFFYGDSAMTIAPTPAFEASVRVVRIGGLTIGDLACNTAFHADLGTLDAYHVDMVLSGLLRWRQGASPVRVAVPGRAAVFQPDGPVVLECRAPGCRRLAVKIDRHLLEREWESLTGAPARTPVPLPVSLDVTNGAGRTWAALVQFLSTQTAHPDGLLAHPQISSKLCEAVVRALLLIEDQRHQPPLVPLAPATAPQAVHRAIHAMRQAPQRSFTLKLLAGVSGVSPRSLQLGFHQHLQTSPMAYLKRLRLARAHDDLARAVPSQAGVAEIAHRWGFGHLGRFAADYQALYGAHPSRTLRDGASTEHPT